MTGEKDVKSWASITGSCPTVGPKKICTEGMKNSLLPTGGCSGTSQQGNLQTAQDCRPQNLPHSQNRDREKGTSLADIAPSQVKTNNLTRNPLP